MLRRTFLMLWANKSLTTAISTAKSSWSRKATGSSAFLAAFLLTACGESTTEKVVEVAANGTEMMTVRIPCTCRIGILKVRKITQRVSTVIQRETAIPSVASRTSEIQTSFYFRGVVKPNNE